MGECKVLTPGIMVSYYFTGGEFNNYFLTQKNTDIAWHNLLSDKLCDDVITAHCYHMLLACVLLPSGGKSSHSAWTLEWSWQFSCPCGILALTGSKSSHGAWTLEWSWQFSCACGILALTGSKSSHGSWTLEWSWWFSCAYVILAFIAGKFCYCRCNLNRLESNVSFSPESIGRLLSTLLIMWTTIWYCNFFYVIAGCMWPSSSHAQQ